MSNQLDAGQQAPDFALRDGGGNQVTLADLRGSRAVVYFYPKAFTPGCTTEACDFRDNHEALAAQGYRVVGISGDDPQTLRSFAQEHDLPFTLLSDPGSETAKAWGAWGEREIKGETSEGPLRSTFLLNEEGVVEGAEYKVGVPGHVANLLKTARP